MWRRLGTLAVCGTLALWADLCHDLPTSPPEESNFTATPRSLAFRLTVKPGGPAFRITVPPLLLKWQVGSSNTVRAGEIEVAGCGDGTALQSLAIMAWQPIHFGATFRAQDVDFDGYLDFSVLTEYAGKWASRSYWVYDPVPGRFVENELTRVLGQNCLGAEWHHGCRKSDSIGFDAKTHEISAHYLGGAGRCGSQVDRYRLEKGRLINVHREVFDMSPSGCTLTLEDRIGGTMRTTKVRRFDVYGEPAK